MQEAPYRSDDIAESLLDAQASDRAENYTQKAMLAPTHSSERAADALWQDIQQILREPMEQRIAFLLFHCGLTPNEIIHRCANEFSDLREVLRLRYVVLNKLSYILSN